MAEPTRPMAELVAEVLDRHKELTASQSFRVFWALKLTTLVAILGGLSVGSFWLGRWTAPQKESPQSGYTIGLSVRPFDDSLPKLSDAKFDGRTLEQLRDDIKRREEGRKSLKGLSQALQKSVYEEDKGKRFAWSGVVTGFSVRSQTRDGKFISVGILSGNKNADCLFSEAGNMGRLMSIKEGDKISVTGVLDEYGDLVRCEFLDAVATDKAPVK
jgi:hypothetical protein